MSVQQADWYRSSLSQGARCRIEVHVSMSLTLSCALAPAIVSDVGMNLHQTVSDFKSLLIPRNFNDKTGEGWRLGLSDIRLA